MAMATSKIDFGVCLQQLPWEPIRERARLAEELGYHSLWLIDHFVGSARRIQEMPECIATLGALAIATNRIRLGSLVIGNSYRNPALLAKSLATIDSISGGRLEIGIGSGWFEADYDAYGYRFEPIGVRLEQLDESIQILKPMLANEQASFSGGITRLGTRPMCRASCRSRTRRSRRGRRREGDALDRGASCGPLEFRRREGTGA
jgi:alkanesulfonate monooxygenase SsuD/methylene tetrahydromethanopterin reductase-like flavin-dependent oxidoreductase (luciferase family)